MENGKSVKVLASSEYSEGAELLKEQALRGISELDRANMRLRFLAKAGEELSRSLDYESTLKCVVNLSVPDIADWCVVYLLEEGGRVSSVMGEHRCPDKQRYLLQLQQKYPILSQGHPIREVLQTGKSIFFPTVSERVLRSVSSNCEHRELLKKVDFNSVIIAPLKVHDSVIGALLFTLSGESGNFNELDLLLAEELARRAAGAVYNSRLAEEAQKVSKAKSDFLAAMSHELRTPLTAIIGYSELLIEELVGPVNAAQKQQLQRVSFSSQHLLHLINLVLDYSRLEAGGENVVSTSFVVNEVVEETVDIMRPMAVEKSVQLLCSVSVEGKVNSDEAKIRQILLNLISNAIKFTPSGAVTVSAEKVENQLILKVTDTGIGISNKEQEKIFSPFWQAQSSGSYKVGGTGLGLTVTKGLVDILQGRLDVESEVGVGSSFRVTLPLKDSL